MAATVARADNVSMTYANHTEAARLLTAMFDAQNRLSELEDDDQDTTQAEADLAAAERAAAECGLVDHNGRLTAAGDARFEEGI